MSPDAASGANVIDLMAALKKSVGDEETGQSKTSAKRKKSRLTWRVRASPLDPLATYNAKRDFDEDARTFGQGASSKGGNLFIVQKHDATRLHWDLRLEIDGVLKSWAVTKGPSPDPDIKRLAVRTEDHPMSYAEFEGTIPKGEYGGGTVMLWDRGALGSRSRARAPATSTRATFISPSKASG